MTSNFDILNGISFNFVFSDIVKSSSTDADVSTSNIVSSLTDDWFWYQKLSQSKSKSESNVQVKSPSQVQV